jgi:hypothetical protein
MQLSPHPPQSVGASMSVSQPSSASPLQSSKPGSHVSTRHMPPVHEVDATCMPRGQSTAGSPSSVVPSQFSSTPSQLSTPSPLISGSVSSQSRPKQPTPPPKRSPSSSTQQRSPTGAHTGSGIASPLITHAKRDGHSGRSITQSGMQAMPPLSSGMQ